MHTHVFIHTRTLPHSAWETIPGQASSLKGCPANEGDGMDPSALAAALSSWSSAGRRKSDSRELF